MVNAARQAIETAASQGSGDSGWNKEARIQWDASAKKIHLYALLGRWQDVLECLAAGVNPNMRTPAQGAPPIFYASCVAEQNEAWKYKYLLDIDGNAFSGRFYAFLKSKSLVYKLAVFREWHEEWLKPWVHYVPLSLRGDEWVEAVRWFAGEPSGKQEAEHIAMQGREWANKVLRNEDLEVWFFRLLLEYARVIDDDREIIGYTGS